ncbi:adenylyltransferase/cytidyltransferase family protein [Candidatus Micrarchaeota archaeon]|nr:adenylyltransferase/cytidyltransferase family protein [Candidatus Micrarchaeota archaeon]
MHIIKKLYVMQLTYGGIPEDIYHFLQENERKKLIEKNGRFFLSEEERKKIKIVLTGGVYDILHIGHIFTLEEAKKHGDVLVVAVARENMIKRKNREPIHSQDYRVLMVSSLKAVDIAIPGFEDSARMLEYVRPDVIVYGYDQKEFLKPEGVKIVKLEKKIDDTKFKTGKIIEELGI